MTLVDMTKTTVAKQRETIEFVYHKALILCFYSFLRNDLGIHAVQANYSTNALFLILLSYSAFSFTYAKQQHRIVNLTRQYIDL
ncbi:hypothetical protein MCQ_00500 [Candidatus Bartonella washoeensis Sb944nv]|uniref:Uncharacterized protein n=1 Tax=Candidatus Bartonella washoeensis Sb944nv TaxID=1094563 RepID=J1J7P1_9HYPH|nr:hypothetical protein MCQ_00500 [Bartonella washoeensis Sb944nv]